MAAKLALLAVAFSVMMATSSAFGGLRKLQQDGLFNCGGVHKLGESAASNKCCELCWCMGNQSPNKILSVSSLQSYCRTQCSQCVAAANDTSLCPSGDSPLPTACSQGLQFNSMVKTLVDKCAGMYFAEPGSLVRTQC